METLLSDLVKDALAFNAAYASIAEVASIQFDQNFRTQCEQNSCGSYNRNGMCPPAVGPIGDLIERVRGFKQGLLFQTIHPLEDSFDWEGMQEGIAHHEKVVRNIFEQMKKNTTFTEVLPLSVGPCLYCKKCAHLDGEKCYFPAQAVSSVEAYGINVTKLVKAFGIPYKNGNNTVSYIGLILFK